ncbi:MAG: tRNA (N6-isopentenyl adenosine(37)-C2)-methylthiotransferase MiaB [Oscillospiraceae bacterium]
MKSTSKNDIIAEYLEVDYIETQNTKGQTDSYSENMRKLSSIVSKMDKRPKCFIRTFGCQQNVSDSERVAGMMGECGYSMTAQPDDADLIVFNTCAVREHAEDRVFGNVGELKKFKRSNPKLIIAVGGCMVQQKHIADKLKKSYPYVDVIFNTNKLEELPFELFQHLESSKTIVAETSDQYEIFENLPIKRDRQFRAYIPVMFGCDNYCTYCIVPFVRGRERSRASAEILRECKKAVNDGYRDIMLLGQNVNSYGKGLDEDINFSKLLQMINAIDGDFTIRFMTSHPKDATHELFDTIAECEKISKQIHLPVQSGSDRILLEMNRRYTSEDYMKLIDYAKSKIPGVSFTSDIIVGFPGETQRDFDDTVKLIKRVGFNSLFTFIYSKREGTKAALMPDSTDHKTKADRLNSLTALQDEITEEHEKQYVGQCFRALAVEKIGDRQFDARLDNNSAVTVEGECELFQFCDIVITERTKKRLFGKVIK